MRKDIRQKTSVESAAAIEKLYRDILILNNFIVKELKVIESNSNFDEKSKKAARRCVFEQAARKLETIKGRSKYTGTVELPEMKLKHKAMEEENALLQFLREKEVRDRIYGMSEAQILSIFGESLYEGSNPLLLNAIINAPEGFEPISKRTLKKIRQAAGAGSAEADCGKKIESVPDVNSMIAKIFSLLKNELDSLRRKELPSSLTQSNESRERPFKF